jgi:hypothetical protein
MGSLQTFIDWSCGEKVGFQQEALPFNFGN